MEYLRRHIEDILDKSFSTFKSVLVTGARQTGKSTLLDTKYPNVNKISFDDAFMEDQAKENPDMFLSMNGIPLYLDEFQYVPSLFRYLKMHCDKNKNNGQYLLTGSQPFKLMNMASESMAGRIAIIELSTLSLRELFQSNYKTPFIPTLEYIQARKGTENKPENVWQIIHRGLYPEIQNPDLDWSMFYSSYVKTYLERDVRELSNVQDLSAFRNLMIACAARTGQMLNYSNIADEIGKDANTVKNWISVLEASGLIYILEPFANSALKRAIKTPKLYFRDTGLAAYLTRWLTPESLANGAMSGPFFETFVISEILKSYSNRGLDYRYFVSYYRGKDKKKITKNGTEQYVESEIDFIIEQDGVLYPIEIKKDEHPDASMTSAFQVLNDLPDKKRGTGAVICNCAAPGVLRENVFAIPYFYI